MPSAERPTTFTLESYVGRSFNYFERMVDSEGVPYFNVFWTEPAEAAHDTPCYGDVMARQLQAVIMARHMTGRQSAIEAVWREKLLSYIDPATGVFTRPEYPWSVTEKGILCDRALILDALVTAFLDEPSERFEKIAKLMADRTLDEARTSDFKGEGFLPGFMIKSLMDCYRHLDYEPALEAARLLVRHVFEVSPLFTEDNTFQRRGHMHGNLRTLLGAAHYAVATSDEPILDRVDALYRYVRSLATRFGFLPEVVGRQGDIIACETCALMDFAGLAATLANHGRAEYWDDLERLVRNHLVESQVADGSWLHSDNSRPDSEQFTWRDIGDRMIGGYAGWSSPNHILAAEETIPWGGPELHGKTRAFQNCCGGSGVHALFIAWKNAARFENGVLSVNLHIDKLLPEAEIRCRQPYHGSTMIKPAQPCRVRIRIPDFAGPGRLIISINGVPSQFEASTRKSADERGEIIRTTGSEGRVSLRANYLELGHRRAGDVLVLEYPLPYGDEEVSVGNPGFRQYRYRVSWKGDTVIGMEPVGDDFARGYSEFEKADVPVYYGREGPGPLYRRAGFLADAEPQESPIHLDTGELDLWHFG